MQDLTRTLQNIRPLTMLCCAAARFTYRLSSSADGTATPSAWAYRATLTPSLKCPRASKQSTSRNAALPSDSRLHTSWIRKA